MDIVKELLGHFTEKARNDIEKSGLKDYFKERKVPRYFFSIGDIESDDKKGVIEDAERVLSHNIFSWSFNGPIDWHFNPTGDTSRDNEWSWSLFRNIYWQPLIRAYALTGDERYAREFADEMSSFIDAWPAERYIENTEFEVKSPYPGHAWRTIEAGIRIYTTWLPAFEVFRVSESFTDELMAKFILFVRDHARFLMTHYSNHDRSSNWLSMETSALFQIAIMFPEFEEAKSWKRAGYQRIMHEIPYCFSSNGVHMERTPIYHLVAVIAFLQAIELGRINGVYIPDYAKAILVKGAKYLMSLIKPDLSTPMIGDADRTDLTTKRADTSIYEGMNLSFNPKDENELRAFFLWMYTLTGDEAFKYFSTQRREGKAPNRLDWAYSDEGIFVERSSWERDGDYMMLLLTTLERGERSTHSHEDAAHIELSLKGEDVLTDSGRYIYRSSIWRPWRDHFTSPKSHNTLLVDDHEMGKVPNVDRVRGIRGILNSFEDLGWAKVIDLSHNAYAFMDDPIFHRRRAYLLKSHKCVVIDSITGPGEEDHDLSLFYNFERGSVSLDGSKGSFISEKGSEFDFGFTSSSDFSPLLFTGSEEPMAGWISYGYPVRVPRPSLEYRLSKRAGIIAVFAISSKGELPEISIKGSDVVISDEGLSHTIEGVL